MKKIFFALWLNAITLCAIGNIMPPTAFISEIFIDSLGNWTIEMGIYEFEPDIDEIRIVTSSGNSIISTYQFYPVGGYPQFEQIAVITNENLEEPVSIDPRGDYVKLISYSWGDSQFDSIAFGDFPGSTINCIEDGESISFVVYTQSMGQTGSFCIDKSPSIGLGNDTTGALGSYTGKFYDPSGNVFTEGWFRLSNIHNTIVQINPDGSFSERIFSRRYAFDTINLRIPPWPYSTQTYAIEPVDFCLRPDTLHHQDIIATQLVTRIDDKEVDFENAVVVSPNPFTNKVTFYINPGQFDQSDEISLLVYNQQGEILKHLELLKDQKKYDWMPDETILPGVLIFNLNKNGRTIKSGKIVKL